MIDQHKDVLEMALRNLTERGLLTATDGRFRLTDAGEREAQRILAGGKLAVTLVNAWTVYSDGTPDGPRMVFMGRPQDWGDPRWMYRMYNFQATVNGVVYTNEVHCWHEGHLDETEHVATFASTIVLLMQPGTPRWKATNEELDEDDFWQDAWGPMPPHHEYKEDDDGDDGP